MRSRTLTLALLLFLAFAAPAGAATRGLDVGFSDDLFTSANAADRGWSLDAARSSGGSIVRINLFWRSVAPTRPAAPQDPADPAYRWAAYDAGVRDAQARGLNVLLTITGAPAWAEGPGRSSSAAPGTWKPDPRALGDFAAAAARRYPAVTRWQIWNEPNLNNHLAPQWTRRNGRSVRPPPRSTGGCSTRPTPRSRASIRATRSSSAARPPTATRPASRARGR